MRGCCGRRDTCVLMAVVSDWKVLVAKSRLGSMGRVEGTAGVEGRWTG